MTTGTYEIRETTASDVDPLLALYPRAFPDEELRPLVCSLLEPRYGVLSLVAAEGGSIAGHVLFTSCGTGDGGLTGALLGPLGVVPSRQRQGLGSALIRAGLDRLAHRGVGHVFVLGDPAYYGRFGFEPERLVETPFPIPDAWANAWQSLLLTPEGRLPAGRLVLPGPWMDSALWRP